MPDTTHYVTQTDADETSTRRCICGATITWAGIDDRLDAFTAIHGDLEGRTSLVYPERWVQWTSDGLVIVPKPEEKP